MKNQALVSGVLRGSIAEEAGIEKGDVIVSINGRPIRDELDFRFYSASEFLTIYVLKRDGGGEIIEVENSGDGDLGIEFESALFGGAKSCVNKCIFCFIDQLPRGMRDTLYFKDDDTRLSFLNGNYITLTNVTEADIDKIIEMRLDPVNISVHTTDPKLREFMLKNKRAGDILRHMNRLRDGRIHMNCQIVLVRGVNDGCELDKTIAELSRLSPYVTSVSVVPVGITRYRDGLFPLTPYDAEESKRVLEQVEKWQSRLLSETGTRFVYAADEFYVKAGIPVPADEAYEGYHQIENGVGLIRSLIDEFMDAMEKYAPAKPQSVSLITGEAAYDTLLMLSKAAKNKYEYLDIIVHKIKNNFFGEQITVAGLLTGGDIVKQLQGVGMGGKVIIPETMLKSGTDLFLDDTTVSGVGRGIRREIIVSGRGDLWRKIIC